MIFIAWTFLISHSPATEMLCPVRSVFPAMTLVTMSWYALPSTLS